MGVWKKAMAKASAQITGIKLKDGAEMDKVTKPFYTTMRHKAVRKGKATKARVSFFPGI